MITYSCWDFAGQEVYYLTHQFFLSERSIYLVIFNMMDPNFTTKLEYWLNSVRSRASDPKQAPVLLVGTHADEKGCDEAFLKKLMTLLNKDFISRFFNIQGFVPVSSTWGREKGLEELDLKMAEIAKKKNLVGQTIPSSYLLLMKALRNQDTIRDVRVTACRVFVFYFSVTAAIEQRARTVLHLVPLPADGAQVQHRVGR